jgi:Bacterial lipoate protein ligase C-terminus
VKPLDLLGLQLDLLETIGSGESAPALLLFQLPGEVISLGRYHLYGGPAAGGGVAAYRRLTGGRIINPGAGWVGCALILPSRTAGLTRRDAALRPEQVMNRYARGAIAAVRALGADCFYPGRDAITCAGRELAMCTFEETAGGALLFETYIALDRGLDSLPSEMDRFDPEGNLSCRLYDRETCTCLARELGRPIGFEELAGHLEAGYGAIFGAARQRDLTTAQQAAAGKQASKLEARWLSGRAPDPSLRLVGRQSIQLGSIETRLAAPGDHIERIEFYGDFIADCAGLNQFEQTLAGKRLDLMTLTAAAIQTYGDGAHFILGCGDLTNLARLILKAS